MSRTKVSYPFAPVPTDVDPAWDVLPFQTRMLGDALWKLGKGEPIPVPADGWAAYLCTQLKINAADRPNVARSLRRLNELGLLRVSDGSATCLLRVCQVSDACLTPVCTVSAERKAAKPLKSRSTEEKRVEEIKESESAQARTRESSAQFERPPLPPLPGDLPPSEPAQAALVWNAYHRLIGLELGTLGGMGRFYDACQRVAGAATTEAGGSSGAEWTKAVERILGAWMNDKWVRENKPSLANLGTSLHRYVLKRPVAKAAQRKSYWTDAELLEIKTDDEARMLDVPFDLKQRRWELIARREAAESVRAQQLAAGAAE